MKKEEVNSEIDETVDKEATTAETIRENEEVEAAPAEATGKDDAAEAVTDNADIPSVTVTSEEFDAENQPVAAQKKKFKMKPWQIALSAVGAVLLIAIIVLLSIFLPLIIRNPIYIAQSSEINGYFRVANYMATTSYNGAGTTEKNNSVELGDLFKDATAISLKGESAAISIDGTTITAIAAGTAEVSVTFKDGTHDQTITVIDGVNVYDYAQLQAASQDASVKNIVLQSDITYAAKTEGGKTVALKANLYGNTHKVDGTPYTKDYNKFSASNYKNEWTSDVMFKVDADNVEINGVHMRGKDLEKQEDEKWQHDEYADGGELIDIYQHHGIVIKNCVLEKAFKCVWMKESTVTIEGTLMREVADGCISMETNNVAANKLTLKNNVMISPQVAGIIVFNIGYANPIPAEINIEGFLDIYNWKNTETAKLMPITEGFVATLVNNLIGRNLDNKQYTKMMVEDNQGDKWLHIAIVVLASNNGGVNEPTINNVKITTSNQTESIPNVSGKDAYIKRQLPFGDFQELVDKVGIKTGNMIGYETMPTVKEMQPENPNLIKINEAMFKKMYSMN